MFTYRNWRLTAVLEINYYASVRSTVAAALYVRARIANACTGTKHGRRRRLVPHGARTSTADRPTEVMARCN